MSHPIIRFLDRAKETTSTTGTGTITLGGAVAGFVAIGGIGDGNSTYYTITEGNEFEVGIGTYTSSGNTLSRDQVFASSNAGNKITLAGSATIFITYPADKVVAKTSGNYVGIGIDPEYQLQVSGTGSFNTVRWADGTTQITSATGDISTVSGLTVTNASNISTNTTNIAATGATNAAAIATNTTDIATNVTNIAATGATNAAAIVVNTTNIAATGATNAAAIATNATDIATNTTNIAATGATNAAAIATNATDIATNTTNIAATGATNAAAIVVNATDIDTVSGLLGPSGSNTQVQFNDNGVFAGDSDFTWNKTSNTLTIAGYALPNADAGISGYVLTSNADGTTQWAEASGGGSGGGAPTNADYITLSTNAGLSDERVLAVGTGLQLTDGGAGGNVTVDASGATTSNQGIVQLQDSLSTSTTTAITPNAVNTASGNLQSSIDTNTTNIATNVTNIAATGATNAAAIATNVTNIATNATNIAATGATNAAAIATNATDIATNATNIAATGATNAAAIATNTTNIATNTTNIAATGATNAAAIATNTTNIATNATNIAATGATNAAAIATNATDITTNTTNIAATGATNAAAIAANTTNISTNTTNIAATGATNAAAIAVNADDIDTVSGLLGPAGNNTTLQFNDGGAYGGDNNLTWNKTSKVLTLSGTLDSSPTGSAGGGIYYTHLGGKNGTATLTVTVASKTSDHPHHGAGSSDAFFIDGKESPAITLYPNISYKFDQADGSNGGHPLRFYYDAAKTTAYTTNVTTNGTAGSAGAYTQIEVVGGTGTPSQLFYQCSAHAYMGNYTVQNTTNLNSNVAVSNENGFLYTLPTADASLSGYVLTSNSDGTTKWAPASGTAGSGGGAPLDAQYVTLALDGGLSDERVLVVGTGLQLTDGGANSNVTVDASGATTSNIGVVQLQDSATDGTVDKAITPNAVYDVSGVLQTNIASTGATNAAGIATNVTDIATNTTNIAATGATNAAAIVVNTTNIAATGATNAAAIATNATDIATNATNIAATGATNAAAIATNTTNIAATGATNAAAIATNATDIATNATNIAATGATNAAAIATNTTNIAATGATNAAAIATNTTNISANATNIAATGATNAADIVTVSGIAVSKDNYQYWTSTDGSNNANIETTDTVKYTGAGTVTVSLASGSPSVVTISGSPHDGSGGGGVPGGSDTNVQFNDGGSFSGVDNFTFTKAGSGILKVGTIIADAADAASYPENVAVGSGARASATQAVAVGAITTATGPYTTAVGYNANAATYGSVAIGQNSNAYGGTATVAVGHGAGAIATQAVAIGYLCTAAGQRSIVIGDGAGDNSNTYAVSIGAAAKSNGTRSVAVGRSAQASAYSVALGYQATAPTSGLVIGAAADNSILSGLFNSSSSATNGYLLTSTKFGINRTSAPDAMLDVTNQAATDVGAIIQGAASQTADLTQWQNSAGTTLASMGLNTANDFATMLLSGTIVSNSTDAGRNRVISIGSGTEAKNDDSIAIGTNALCTRTDGGGAIAIGLNSDAGLNSLAVGKGAQALGDTSCAIGNGANVNGNLATALGTTAYANGDRSVSIGYLAVDNSNAYSVSVGTAAESQGNSSVSLGAASQASTYSAAIGYGTHALGTHSVVMGYNVRTSANSGLVIGAAADNHILSGHFNSSTSHTDGFLNVLANKLQVSGDGSVKVNNQYTFPTGDASSSGHVLTSYADGTTVWAATTGGGGGTPDTPLSGVQFNDNGAFGAESNFTFSKAGSGILKVGTIVTSDADADHGAVSIGSGAAGGGNETVAIGANANAGGGLGIAIGRNAVGSTNLVVGHDASASTDYRSIAIGGYATANVQGGTAVGREAVTTGKNSVAVGYLADSERNGIAIGVQAEVHVDGGIALGKESDSNGYGAISLGYRSYALGDSSIAIGRWAVAPTSGFVVGAGDVVGTQNSILSGLFNSSAASTNGYLLTSTKFGINRTSAPDAMLDVTNQAATDVGAIIQGAASQTADLTQWQNSAGTTLASMGMTTSNDRATLMVSGTIVANVADASRIGVVSIGSGAYTSANDTVAIGSEASAGMLGAIAIGKLCDAQRTCGIAIGYQNVARDQGIAIGYISYAHNSTVAIGHGAGHSTYGGSNSVFIGSARSLAGDSNSIAIGYGSRSAGPYSISLGYYSNEGNSAHDGYDVCIGNYAEADAYAIALGHKAKAPTSGLVIGAGDNNSILSGQFNSSTSHTDGFLNILDNRLQVSGDGSVKVNNQYTFPTGDASVSGHVLTSYANGTTAWAAAGGSASAASPVSGIQFNTSGSFAASTGMMYDSTLNSLHLNSLTSATGDFQMKFTASGVGTTAIDLNVLDRVGSTSGTTLSFDGTQGQLFSVVDNLQTGTIFSVSDIIGLPLISVDASGDVQLAPYGNNVGVKMTGTPAYQLDVYGTGNFASGVRFPDGNVQTIAYTGGAGGGTPDTPLSGVQFNDNGSFGAESNFTFSKAGSGILKVGTIVTNDADAAHIGVVSIGSGAYAVDDPSVGADGAVAIGRGAKAPSNSVAIGRDADGGSRETVAIGYSTYAYGQHSTAIGYDCQTNGSYAAAIGHTAVAESRAYAIGKSITSQAHGIGIGNFVNVPESGFVIGNCESSPNAILSGLFNSSSSATNGYLLTSTKFGINRTSAPDAMLDVTNQAATDVGAIIQGAASQSADLTQWQNSAGTTMASMGMFTSDRAIMMVSGTIVSNVADASRDAVVSIGSGTYCGGHKSVAIGHYSWTNAYQYAVSIGHYCRAGSNSVAIGDQSKAESTSVGSVAIGSWANTYANPAAIAIGYNAGVTAQEGVAIGASAEASVSNGTAVGADAHAAGSVATAIGQGTRSNGESAVALGHGSTAATRSVAIGRFANAPTSGFVVVADGHSSSADLNNSILSGLHNYTSSSTNGHFHILNNKLVVSGDGSVKVNNQYTFPTGDASVSGHVLTSYADGTTVWAAASGGSSGSTNSATPSSGLQFNDGSNGFAASTGMLYDSTLNSLHLNSLSALATGDFQMKFTASGVGTTAVDLNVLDRVGSVSGTTLSFEGTEGQLFAIEDNLSSGSIFSVSDIAGLPLIEADASGDVSLAKYGRYVSVSHTGAPEYQLDVAGGTGNFTTVKTSSVTGVSAIEFADGSTQTTAPAGGGTVATGVVSGIAFFHNAGQVRSIDNFAFNSGNDPQVEFKGTGVGTTNINLAILDRIGSTSGTTLSFEGSDGQLLGIVDNLASGTIFSVADIAGLPIMEADASGDVKLTAYGRNVGVAMTGTPAYQLDVYGTGNFVSGVRFPDGNVQTIAYTGGAGSSGPDGSDTYVQFNDGGSAFGGESNFTFTKAGSGILKVGTIVTNDADAARLGAVSIGSGAYLGADHAIAIGTNAYVIQESSIAIGSGAYVTDHSSIAIGKNSRSSGGSSITIGKETFAGANAVAIGANVDTHDWSVAIGSDVHQRSVAVGNSIYNAGGVSRAVLLGHQINFNAGNSLSDNCVVIGAHAADKTGYNTSWATIVGMRAKGDTYGTALGSYADAGKYGVAIGYYATAPTSGLVIGAAADNSILSGSFNTSAASTNGYLLTSTKFGINRTSAPDAMLDVTNFAATDVGAIIQGAASQTADLTQWQNSAGTTLASMGMTTSNDRATLMVSGTIVSNVADASRVGVVSIGSGAYSTQDDCVVIGRQSWSNSQGATVIGRSSYADNASNSVALGYWAYARGNNAVAIGRNVHAHQDTVCIGYDVNYNNRSATRSVFINTAQPHDNNADGSVAIGYRAWSRGPYSVSIGHEVNYSISAHDGHDVAIGNYTKSEAYGIAFGYQASAPTSGLVIGASAHNSILSGQFNSSTNHTDGFLNVLNNNLQVSGDGSVKVNNQYTFPTGDASSSGHVLTSYANGTTAWASAGGGSPGGSDTQIQFNAGGTTFAGDNALVWNSGTNVLTISGHLAATTKSFLIDHPTIPEKKLQYACLEGPENGVYVRGHTNDNIIDLPDYWSSLVDEESITVQITAKDAPQPYLYVSGVLNNKVYLISDRSVSAYYTINGTRKDVEPLEVEI